VIVSTLPTSSPVAGLKDSSVPIRRDSMVEPSDPAHTFAPMSARTAAHLRQNLLGLVAIFLALTAGAYAVQKAPKNSVVSKSIKKGAVKSSDIGDGKVTGADIDESSLSGVPGADGGTVTSVGSGAGLTGGPITGSGSLALAPCPNDQLLKSNGSGYACAPDANAGGDITGVAAGSGLAGGGAAGPVALALAPCGNGQFLKSTGSGYACDFGFVWGTAFTSTSGGTLNVSFNELVRVDYSSPSAITDLTAGVDGQRVTLRATNGNPSITDGGNFFLNGNWTPDANDTLTVIQDGGDWYEVARSANSP
jgi:hypothetical protein